jgi:uncharacterized protein YeaO (DUF488 family)
MPRHQLQIKRVHEPPDDSDGRRVLVERLWPRGVSKEKAALDDWLKEIAPSPELRRWFAHDLAKWEEFRRRYRHELQANPEPVDRLLGWIEDGPVTLIFAASDTERNSAVLLERYLRERMEQT